MCHSLHKMELATILTFCVLITQILAHDHVKSHGLRHLQHSWKENNPNKTKNCTCPSSKLIFKYNSKSKVEYVFNQTEKGGFIAQINSTIVVVFDSPNRFALAMDYESHIGVCFSNDAFTDWQKHLSSATNLKVVIEAGKRQGQTFRTTSIPANVSQKAAPILKSLSPDYSHISDLLEDARRSSCALKLYSEMLDDVSSGIQGNFHSFCNRLEGISDFVNKLRSRINLNDTRLNFGDLFGQQTGADVLSSLLKQLGNGYGLREILGEASSSQSRLLSLMSSLGGGAHPADTLFKIFAQFFEIATTPMRIFISTLIQFFGMGAEAFATFVSGAQNVARTMTRFPGSGASGFGDFVRNLANASGSINGVNSSQILEVFRNRDSRSAIYNIVHWLSLLSREKPLEESIPNLFGQLISLYQNGSHSTLGNLVPNLDFGGGEGSGGDIAQNVVGQFLHLFQAGAGAFANFATLFGSIPARFFITLISGALTQFSNMSFIDIFRSQNSFQLLQQAVECESGSLLGNGTNPLSGFEGALENIAGNIADNGNKTGNSSFQNLANNIEDSILGRGFRNVPHTENAVKNIEKSIVERGFNKVLHTRRAQSGNSKKVVAAAEALASSFGESLGKGSGLVKNAIKDLSHREKKSHSRDERHHAKAISDQKN